MTPLPSFDPRTVPVVGIDGHLPKVPADAMTSDAVASRFAAVHAWSPETHTEPRFSGRELARASVLIPLVIHKKSLTVLLTQRTAHLSSHSGQIAFPGGKADLQDRDAVDTALRETEEEVGLARQFVTVLGELPTYTTGSAYVITPVVALVHEGFSITANANEVADVFEVPLEFLMDPAHHRRHAVEWAGQRREWLSIPYMEGDKERFIWGATAAMLRNFYRFLLV